MIGRIREDKGGLTVEATLILPMFVMFVIVFIYILESYYLYSNINTAMYSAAGEFSSKVYSSDSILNNEYKKVILGNLEGETMKSVYKGSKGIDFEKCYYDNLKDEIFLISRYSVAMPINVLGIGNYRLGNNMVVRGWTGNRQLVTNKNFVYVTKSGKVYHTDIMCTYLCVKKVTVPRDNIGKYRNEGNGKYYECKTCKNEKKSKYVYITKYGTSYHNIKSCSSISRTIIPIDIYEIEGRKKCEKCCK